MSTLPGIDDATLERAGLTAKQIDALKLYVPGERGYKSVALALDIDRDTARGDRIRKLELAMRPEQPAARSQPVSARRHPAARAKRSPAARRANIDAISESGAGVGVQPFA